MRYTSNTRTVAALPRSKRLRDAGIKSSASPALLINERGESLVDPNSHAHANKSDLDRISIEEGYLMTETKIETDDDVEILKERARVGYADFAGDVAPDSPAFERFARKDIPDTFHGAMTFEQGAYFGDYSPEESGGAFWQDEQGNWHVEADVIMARKKFKAYEVEIMKTSHIGGRLMNTCASCRLYAVRGMKRDGTAANAGDTVAYWRCYFMKKDGDGNEVHNLWRVGDQAYCETFNLVRDANGFIGNHYYWRLVLNVSGDGEYDQDYFPSGEAEGAVAAEDLHWIDLSNDYKIADGIYGYDLVSDEPMTGDNVVQLGSRTDRERANAIIQSPVGETAPYIKLYKGINSFHLPKAKVDLSPTKVSIRANEIVLAGDDEDEASYVDLSSYIDEIYRRIDSIQDSVHAVQQQTDEQFIIWHGETTEAPTLLNEPACEWCDGNDNELTHDLYSEHVGDFFLTSDGFCYVFASVTDGTYEWQPVNDKWLVAYVQNLRDVEDQMQEMASDGVITVQEKAELKRTWNQEVASHATVKGNADKYLAAGSVSVASMEAKFSTLSAAITYLLVNDAGNDTQLQGMYLFLGWTDIDFMEAWQKYLSAKTIVEMDIEAAIKNAADDAQNAADEAQQAADDAQAAADQANTVLGQIGDDGVITVQEHSDLSDIWDMMDSQYIQAINDAGKYSTVAAVNNAKKAMDAARTKLSDLVAAVLAMTTTYTITNAFNDAWYDFFNKLEALRAAITQAAKDATQAAKDAANDAQQAADDAQQAADDAQQAADDAQAAADQANTVLGQIGDDGVITVQEHSDLSDIWDMMDSQYIQAINDAGKYSTVAAVNNAKKAMDAARTKLSDLVAAVLAMTTTYTITKAFDDAWYDFFNKLEALRAAITQAAKDATQAAKDAADDAQDTADSALSAANSASAILTNMASDNVITPQEKQTLKKLWDEIRSEYLQVLADYDNSHAPAAYRLRSVDDNTVTESEKESLMAVRRAIELAKNGISSTISSYTFTDTDGVRHTVDSSKYMAAYNTVSNVFTFMHSAQAPINMKDNDIDNMNVYWHRYATEEKRVISEIQRELGRTATGHASYITRLYQTMGEISYSVYQRAKNESATERDLYSDAYSILSQCMTKIMADMNASTTLKNGSQLLVYGTDVNGVKWGFAEAWSKYLYHLSDAKQVVGEAIGDVIEMLTNAGFEKGGNFAKMFATAYTENRDGLKTMLAEAFVTAYVNKSGDRYVSGIKMKAGEIVIEGDNFSVDAQGNATFGGYLKTHLVQVSSATATPVSLIHSPVLSYDPTTAFRINNHWNLLCYNVEIQLPTDTTKYIGARVLIVDTNFPPYSRTSAAYKTNVYSQAGSILGNPINAESHEYLLTIPSSRGIQFQGGSIELLGVPPTALSPSNVKCEWLVLSISCARWSAL